MLRSVVRRASTLLALAIVLIARRASTRYLRNTIDGQSALGVVRKGVPIRGLVVYFHGLDRSESILELDNAHKELTTTLANAGYAVVSSNAGGNAFGSPASQRNYVALAFDSARHYGTSNVFFIAESMGTVAAINLMAGTGNTGLQVQGMAAINPLLNVYSLGPEYQRIAEDANPEMRASNPLDLPLETMRGKNLRFYVTPADQLVSTADNSVAFERKFGSVANISVVKCSGEHMDPSCIQGKDIVEWFSSISTQ